MSLQTLLEDAAAFLSGTTGQSLENAAAAVAGAISPQAGKVASEVGAIANMAGQAAATVDAALTGNAPPAPVPPVQTGALPAGNPVAPDGTDAASQAAAAVAANPAADPLVSRVAALENAMLPALVALSKVAKELGL